MYIKNIQLSKFRNYESFSIDLNKGINIIYGDNAQGKTNLLESIYVLALTKSHRSFIDNNLIKSGEKNSVIKGKINIDNIDSNLEINLLSKNKILKIDNNIIKKVSDYISKFNIIIFYPDDLELIKGLPNVRRRFLNLEISQLYSNYLDILNDYNKILKMRNDYIKLINKGEALNMDYFNILTNYYIEKAVIIYQIRNKFINKINLISENIFKNISGLDNFNIKYKTSIIIDSFNKDDLKNNLSEIVKKSYDKEIKLKSTLFGPHKDDLEFYIADKNIKTYGSQGQQRMAVLTLKLSEIEIFKGYTGNYPILLLDDVFSELDDNKKNNLLNYIKNDIQTIITTTDLENIDSKIIDNAKLIKIKNGQVVNVEEVE